LDTANDDADRHPEALEGSAVSPSLSQEKGNGEGGGEGIGSDGASPKSSMESFANNRYIITDFLGEGGKKKVYLAHDNTLDGDVAFALIKAEGLDDHARQRITREAQAMGRLGDNPNIMPIFDIGEENGQPYMGSAPHAWWRRRSPHHQR